MLDPQTKALLDLIIEKGVPPTHLLSPEDARVMYSERRFYSQPDAPDMALVEDITIPGPASTLKLRSYRPIQSKAKDILPALVYYHGGGCVIGDLDTHDVLCRELSNLANIAVLSVDYRLAPENPFPAAADDCIAATQWIHQHASQLNIDANRIAVGGDSAGGNLAAVVCIALRDAKEFKPAFQLLIYPMTDARAQTPSMTSNGQGYLLTKDAVAYYHNHYIPNHADRLDWKASPLLAKDLSKLPPALVITAGYDPLRDEGLYYADQLSTAGVPTQYICFERQIHGFILMGRILDEANTAVKMCAQSLKDHLNN
jgi:acetyl esterase